MKNKGFTLIELLVVIAIIGILSSVVMTSMNAARNKALSASAISTIRSLQPGVALCCQSGGNNLQNAEGGDICSVPIETLLPTAADVKAAGISYTVLRDCDDADPALSISLTDHPIVGCNTSPFIVALSSTTIPTDCK